MNQTSLKGGGRRDGRTEHHVNQTHVHWEDELKLYEEYTALVMTTTQHTLMLIPQELEQHINLLDLQLDQHTK
jgi:hypothetical protein